MKRFLFSSLSVLLISTAIVPAAKATMRMGSTTPYNPLTDPNPPAEVPSPSLIKLDPSSAYQPGVH